ncbi:unannotated protein [freshwater metagenome]|uniref:Unannotated protein n=1 Tax=freshwater metagenome TaxID=449393 RepID=A0A6J6Y152_9ZZZZ
MPVTVQTDSVVDENVTGRPVDAVALTANAGAALARSLSAANVTDWERYAHFCTRLL